MADDTRYITVGKLGRPRGVRGHIWVTPITDFPDRFLTMDEIYLADRASSRGWQRRTITAASIIGSRPVLKLEGVDSKEDAARLTNRELAVTDDQLVELPEGSYYTFDLVGCRVFDASNGSEIGELTDVRHYPVNDVYVIRTGDGQEKILPAVRQYVQAVNIGDRRIDIDPAGLLEEA